eukprot:CCRYP_000331-RA/>CCRYP_000331-RA protein AED:0.21 eAED:0.21 QI:0/0/0/1/1/1/2/0/211
MSSILQMQHVRGFVTPILSAQKHSLKCTRSRLNMGDNDDFNMDILRQRMEKQETQYAKLLMEQSKYYMDEDLDVEEKRPLPESVYIILFLPETPQQHVHTIEVPKGSGNNMLLAFEDEEDCHVFAQMLKDLDFVDPCPEETEFAPLTQYCQSIGMPLAIVPPGFELTPPQINSNDETDDDDGIGGGDLKVQDDGFVENSSDSDDIELDSWG